MITSESTKMISKALSKAQGAIEFAEKSAENPYYQSHYAPLSAVTKASKKALEDNELSIVQSVTLSPEDSKYMLVTGIFHSSGEWIKTSYPVNPTKADPQGMASAVTYARRNAWQAALGMASVDDDGNKASDKSAPLAPPVPAESKKYAQVAPLAPPVPDTRDERIAAKAWQDYRMKRGNPWSHVLSGESEHKGKILAVLPDELLAKLKPEKAQEKLFKQKKLSVDDFEALHFAFLNEDLREQAVAAAFVEHRESNEGEGQVYEG